MAAALPVASTTMSQPRGVSSSSAEAAERETPRVAAVASRSGLMSRMSTEAAPVRLASLQHHQAHGAGAVDQDLGAERGAQDVVAAHRAGQRLDQRGVLDVDVVGQPDAVGDGRDGELGGAAGLADADRVPPLAQVAAPDPAVVALVAVERGVDGDLVAQGEFGDVGADPDDLAA